MLLLATSSLTFDGFENNDYKNLFSCAPEAGYRRVEFNCWYGETLTPARIRSLKRRCTQAGLEPIALHVSAFGGSTSEIRALNTAHKLRAMEAARELGCRRIVASGTAGDGTLDDILYELECLEPAAGEYEVSISLENHCNNILAGREDYEYLFQRIDSPHIGICLDGGHLEAHGESIAAFIDTFYLKINHLHLKENLIFGQKSFCRFGMGGTDNTDMVKRMKKKGFEGYMSVELSPEIRESGQKVPGSNIPFTMEDWRRPLELFSFLEEG